MAFIDQNKDDIVAGRRLGVESICKVLQVAPSTYYAAKKRSPSARAVRGEELIPRLLKLWKANYRVYGVRKLWKAARRAGIDIGRDQTARLMRAAGIEGVRRSKKVRTTRPDTGVARHPDLVDRNFTATAPKPAAGHRSDLHGHLGRRGVCLFHHRCVLAHDRRLAGRLAHAHPYGS